MTQTTTSPYVVVTSGYRCGGRSVSNRLDRLLMTVVFVVVVVVVVLLLGVTEVGASQAPQSPYCSIQSPDFKPVDCKQIVGSRPFFVPPAVFK